MGAALWNPSRELGQLQGFDLIDTGFFRVHIKPLTNGVADVGEGFIPPAALIGIHNRTQAALLWLGQGAKDASQDNASTISNPNG